MTRPGEVRAPWGPNLLNILVASLPRNEGKKKEDEEAGRKKAEKVRKKRLTDKKRDKYRENDVQTDR